MEQAQTTASTRSAIADEVEKVAKEQGKKLANSSDDLVLLDSGLDSLCFAILVARLEQRLGFDLFILQKTCTFRSPSVIS